jgi:putative drug exporter of the RND superfamily
MNIPKNPDAKMMARSNRVRLPAEQSTPGRLGAWCYTRRRLVVFGWLAVLVVVSFLGKAVGSEFKDSINGGNTGSQRAAAFLQGHFPGQAGADAQIVFNTATPITSPPERIRVTATLDRLDGLPGVVSVAGAS